MGSRTELAVARFLRSLEWDGIKPDVGGMFMLSRAAPPAAIRNVEYVCEHDDRFDWKWRDEA